MPFPRFDFRYLLLPLAAMLFSSCAMKDRDHKVLVSVADQRMAVYDRGNEVCRYDVSTSKFGLGDRPGSNATPLGELEVAKKIGGGAPLGMKFKNRKPTGEIVPVNAPGRDPIVTRIIWLKGLEPQNAHAYDRTIYIHGTAEEWRIGTPASYGCIRMRSRDVADLYNTLGIGAAVEITTNPLPPVQVAPTQTVVAENESASGEEVAQTTEAKSASSAQPAATPAAAAAATTTPQSGGSTPVSAARQQTPGRAAQASSKKTGAAS